MKAPKVIKNTIVLTCAVLYVLLLPVQAVGQTSPPSLSVQVAIGPGKAWTSSQDYRNDGDGLTFDALAAGRLIALGKPSILIGVAGNTQGTFSRTADCLLRPDGSCEPWFPEMEGISVLVGWTSEGDQGRVLIGPSVVTVDNSARTMGWESRAELSTRRILGMSAAVSSRMLLVPSYESETYAMLSLNVGLRISAF